MSELARRYQVPVEDIVEINGLERNGELRPGQVLFVPGGRRAVAREKAAATSRPTERSPSPAKPNEAHAERVRLAWPVPGGVVTSRFGLRGKRPHEGVDIGAPEGSQVVAVEDGQVIYSGSGVRGYGNLILVRHSASGLVSVYAHNRRNLVREKDLVRRGQVIAEVGHTGNASADHLHFEVRRGEIPEDPLPLLDRQ